MRDPSRIKPFLKELENIWLANPDLRLGQIISHAARLERGVCDPFYVEDLDLMRGIKRLLKDN